MGRVVQERVSWPGVLRINGFRLARSTNTKPIDYYTPVLLLLDPFFFDADMAGMQREVTKIYDH